MNNTEKALSRELILRAMFETYESVYVIDMETSAYRCFHESDSYSSLQLENSGDDFFTDVVTNIFQAIDPEDREFVCEKLTKEALFQGLENGKYYSFVYRLLIDGKPLYHKFRATKEIMNGRPNILIGIRNVDASFRQDKAQAEELSAMHNKERNHLKAVLATAAGYLEVNLTRDTILEISPHILSEGLSSELQFPPDIASCSYGSFVQWMLEHLVVENREKYREVSSRAYLMRCFERGEKRVSVSFSSKAADGTLQPCRKLFYLYQDEASGDILMFSVLYDLTEQQRREKELKELEKQLQLSRIRNFTSQMQPHFLYNALGSIQEIVLEDPEYASELIGDFTVHLRSCIRAMSSDDPIPFAQELNNIRAYVNIEKMRLGEKLRVVYDTETVDFVILPLSVQPLVENAIRHGIYERGESGGTVTVRTRDLPNFWQITVEDNGVGFDTEAFRAGRMHGKKESTGLKNIKFRLRTVMGASLEIRSKPGVGTAATIQIPKEESAQHEIHYR